MIGNVFDIDQQIVEAFGIAVQVAGIFLMLIFGLILLPVWIWGR